MRCFLIILVMISSLSQAQDAALTYKNWKTYRSVYGFEFKYPDCWEVEGNGPGLPEIATSSTRDIFIAETDACKRPRLIFDTPNGIGVSAERYPLKSKEEGLKQLAITGNNWKKCKY